MSELFWQVPLGLLFVWLCVRAWRWALRRTPSAPTPTPSFFDDVPLVDVPVMVPVRLLGGMGDGELVEVPAELSAGSLLMPSELCVKATDHATAPPTTHHLLYRICPEDSRLFMFAGTLPAAHEMMGDD